MTALWTAADAARAVGGQAQGDWTAVGVSIDSRTVQPGDLFVALKGPNFDGHGFVGEALDKGAASALVSRIPDDLDKTVPLLIAGDGHLALGALGAAARARTTARIAAVTGSVGKTTSKEMLRLALDSQGHTVASTGSLNNHIGVPLSLARLPADAAFGIFEVGMNHPGEISPLSRLIRPHAALITAVEAVHLSAFASLDAIADAKAEIFDGLEPDGVAVLNQDNPLFGRLVDAAKACSVPTVIGFGTAPGADAKLLDVNIQPTGSLVTAEIAGRALRYQLHLPGRPMAMNSVGVLVTVHALGADPEAAAEMLGVLTPLSGRGARHRIALTRGSAELIDESYNASPASLGAAIDVLGASTPGPNGRRIAVLGDMLELGPRAPALHAALAGPLDAARIGLVFTCGANMWHLHDALPDSLSGVHVEDSAALAPLVLESLEPGDIVMVKGSLGSRMRIVVDTLIEGGSAPQSRHAVNG